MSFNRSSNELEMACHQRFEKIDQTINAYLQGKLADRVLFFKPSHAKEVSILKENLALLFRDMITILNFQSFHQIEELYKEEIQKKLLALFKPFIKNEQQFLEDKIFENIYGRLNQLILCSDQARKTHYQNIIDDAEATLHSPLLNETNESLSLLFREISDLLSSPNEIEKMQQKLLENKQQQLGNLLDPFINECPLAGESFKTALKSILNRDLEKPLAANDQTRENDYEAIIGDIQAILDLYLSHQLPTQKKGIHFHRHPSHSDEAELLKKNLAALNKADERVGDKLIKLESLIYPFITPKIKVGGKHLLNALNEKNILNRILVRPEFLPNKLK